MVNPPCFLLLFSLVRIQTLMCTAARSSTISHRRGGLSLPLIHRDSFHHRHRSTLDLTITGNMRSRLIPTEGGALFSVNVSIGEPPIPQLLVLDTGSDLSWVQCNYCQGCQVEEVSPTYDPTKSSTYTSIPCASQSCSMMSSCNGRGRECLYSYEYHDGTNSSGIIGYEKFTFPTSDDGAIAIPRAVFGCAHTVQYPHKHWQSSGIFGLAASMKSMFPATGNLKFSYCLGNISDPTYMYNKVIIGDGAILEGDSTPMELNGLKSYRISLEGISVGETNIIDPTISHTNVIIDTGVQTSYLKKDALDPLKAEVRKLMNGLLDEVEVHEDYLCFNGDMRRDLHGFPTITLRFAGGSNLELDSEGAFFCPGSTMEQGAFCLAFLEAKGMKDNVIGVIAQQYYNVGFNLENMRVSFQRMDCQLIEGS